MLCFSCVFIKRTLYLCILHTWHPQSKNNWWWWRCCVCVCVHSVMAEPLRLSFSDADGGYKFITPWSRQPIILNTVVLHSHTVHLRVCMCATPLMCVCSSVCVCTPQSGVWVSKLVKVKQIGGVSWLLFNSSRNRSCQEYWLTAFTVDSSTWHVIDIKC